MKTLLKNMFFLKSILPTFIAVIAAIAATNPYTPNLTPWFCVGVIVLFSAVLVATEGNKLVRFVLLVALALCFALILVNPTYVYEMTFIILIWSGMFGFLTEWPTKKDIDVMPEPKIVETEPEPVPSFRCIAAYSAEDQVFYYGLDTNLTTEISKAKIFTSLKEYQIIEGLISLKFCKIFSIGKWNLEQV